MNDALPTAEKDAHRHSWTSHQNVTSKGYVMPAYEACECGAAREVPRTMPSALNDADVVWEFARQFARTSGDSPNCLCISCRAYRAVQRYVFPSGVTTDSEPTA